MQLIDTHCHIHDSNYPLDIGDVLRRAHQAGVGQMICVGTSEISSQEALEFARQHEGVYASIGVHPHDTKEGWRGLENLPLSAAGSFGSVTRGGEEARSTLAKPKGIVELNDVLLNPIVAVGEIGLDYFYTHSPREVQIEALEGQMELALKHNLPIIFHVREAFDDFWPIFDNFHGIKGELHSFTDSQINLEKGLKRGLFIGVNGISTFTKDDAQREMFNVIPLEKMLLETDAPFLTPAPYRGKINEPAFVQHVAEFHAHARGISLEEIAAATTANARALFALS